MPGLTAKVFRTYNASMTLQEQLVKQTEGAEGEGPMLLAYNRANREVAVLCNHQRAAPKTFDDQMRNMDTKEEEIKMKVKNLEKALKKAKKAEKKGEAFKWDDDLKCKSIATAKNKIRKELEKMEKLELARTDKSENKTIALGTSKLNYLDPRISVQWCKSHPGIHVLPEVTPRFTCYTKLCIGLLNSLVLFDLPNAISRFLRFQYFVPAPTARRCTTRRSARSSGGRSTWSPRATTSTSSRPAGCLPSRPSWLVVC